MQVFGDTACCTVAALTIFWLPVRATAADDASRALQPRNIGHQRRERFASAGGKGAADIFGAVQACVHASMLVILPLHSIYVCKAFVLNILIFQGPGTGSEGLRGSQERKMRSIGAPWDGEKHFCTSLIGAPTLYLLLAAPLQCLWPAGCSYGTGRIMTVMRRQPDVDAPKNTVCSTLQHRGSGAAGPRAAPKQPAHCGSPGGKARWADRHEVCQWQTASNAYESWQQPVHVTLKVNNVQRVVLVVHVAAPCS